MKHFFILIVVFLFCFSPQTQASTKDCNLNPSKNSKNYIIGYGSLMERESRMITNPQAHRVEPVLVRGFQRVWGQNGGNYKTTFLTLIEKKDAKLNAIFYSVNIENLLKTDQRERSYCRIKVDEKNLDFYGRKVNSKDANFWIYAATPDRLKKPSATHPIVQSYVDIFINGCLQTEEEFKLQGFAKDCVQLTSDWSFDPIQLSKIDQLWLQTPQHSH
ncbi:MAG: gamma-glutamylcyclotransferase [Candidatus Fonsibacter ubiquis]|nr:gamma-glutamylcyclotransferase [Candidatus Fonsibacter ubiquis]